MSAQLIQHIRSRTSVEDKDAAAILTFFKRTKVDKKENLLDNGAICRSHYFVLKGCLRMFFITEKGVEQTTQFAIENWWLSDYMSFQTQSKSEFSIQAVEKTEMMVIDFQAQEKLMAEFPVMDKYFRMIYQKAYAAAQKRVKYMYEHSKEEQYHLFNASFPEFTQRIPQYLLASYLGFTPEYLSEIRKKTFLKPV